MRTTVLFLLALLVTSVNAQSIKIGYIDAEEVINSLSQYQQDNDSLIQQFEPKKQQLLDLFQHIELLKKNLNDADRSINNENYQKELANIRGLEASFQKETELWQQQLNQKKYESLQKIEALINKAIEEFAISENYDLILYQNAAFASDQVNITNQIISMIEGTSP
jgi:outer membrane protein